VDFRGVPLPGEVISGKYRIERLLGHGGMGAVLAARHIVLSHRVAIKFLLPDAASSPDAMERFLREAQAASSLQSEHVVQVLDVGTTEIGAPYMVLEYLTGDDLSEVVQKRGPLPIAEAVDYILQACDALAEAHGLGILHRDLKPSNLFLARRPDGSSLIKVLDFGLSKLTRDGSGRQSLTDTATVIGSPHYMPPEQIRSLKLTDARSDIWAIGVILYELVTGRRPFDAENVTAVLAMILTEAPAPLRKLRPDVPATLEQVALKCLEKTPGHRYQTIEEVTRALRPFMKGRARDSNIAGDRDAKAGTRSAKEEALSQSGVDSSAATRRIAQPTPVTASSLTTQVQRKSPERSGRAIVVAGSVSLAVIVLVMSLVALQRSSRPEDVIQPSASSEFQTPAAAPAPVSSQALSQSATSMTRPETTAAPVSESSAGAGSAVQGAPATSTVSPKQPRPRIPGTSRPPTSGPQIKTEWK
jgi:serine/threonine-protein kinase